MKLTALEIKQQTFDKAMRGYDMGEVQAFLNLVSNEWEHLVARTRELEQEIDKLQDKLSHYERVESTLHETLQTAKESAEQKLEGAKKESRTIIERAELEADTILREAALQRRQIRQSILGLLDQREQVISGIRSYLDIARNSLDSFAEDEARLFTTPVFEERGGDTVQTKAGPGDDGEGDSDRSEPSTGEEAGAVDPSAGDGGGRAASLPAESALAGERGNLGGGDRENLGGGDRGNLGEGERGDMESRTPAREGGSDGAETGEQEDRERHKRERKPADSGEVDMDDILDQID